MCAEAKIPFKMEKFTKVPAKITAKGLETQEIDAKRSEKILEHAAKAQDEKYFIRANMKGVRSIQMEKQIDVMAT